MASFTDMDFSCPVCLEVYKDPVLLPCSHSFCKACLQNCWGEDGTRQCPVCKRCSFVRDPPCNLILKNLCDAFAQQLSLKQPSQAEAICPHHKEKLQLFCLDHQQPVCLVCRDSRAHHEHKFRPINEMAQDYREQLQKSLLPLQDRLQETSDVIQHWYQTGEYIKQEGDRTEKLIQKEINKMRDFLQKEEQERVQAVRTEVQQKISLMEQNVAALSEEMETLSNSIRQTQEELKASDVAFLQKYSGAVRRVQEAPLEVIPLMPSGGLVDVAKHLGNLGFNIWNQMKDLVSYTPVVLDPNTAFRSLFVSDDLCSVHCANRETELPWVPENPERFIKYVKVLGNEEFTTGKHRWEKEEQKRVQAVRTEVQQKISLMEQNVAALPEEMKTLSNSIRQTQESTPIPSHHTSLYASPRFHEICLHPLSHCTPVKLQQRHIEAVQLRLQLIGPY
uniref:Uncharacterized protein n=1 Tax=Knipowitschia caucasica TaxID=637954 RepID=A0AAV2LSM2_KNICA